MQMNKKSWVMLGIVIGISWGAIFLLYDYNVDNVWVTSEETKAWREWIVDNYGLYPPSFPSFHWSKKLPIISGLVVLGLAMVVASAAIVYADWNRTFILSESEVRPTRKRRKRRRA